ncbi:hypothetical protein GQ473_07375 [archaeon]|nr:hypothetical protein [archaeon]
MSKKINWVSEILEKHNVENEPLLEEQLELFEKDIRADEHRKTLLQKQSALEISKTLEKL